MTMKSYETIIQDLKNNMQTEPNAALRERILDSAASVADEPYAVTRRRSGLRPILVAAAITALTITTAFATDLPGLIKSFVVGKILVNEYEDGSLPHADPEVTDVVGTFTINGGVDRAFYGDGEVTRLGSLEEAREAFGAPLFVPAYLENDEVPVIVKKYEANESVTIEVWYQDAYINSSGEPAANHTFDSSFRLIPEVDSFFILYQTYVGDAELTYNYVGNVTETTVNGYEAMWQEGSDISPQNGILQWVQDGVLIQIMPCGLEMEYVMKIAESLEPMQ